MVFKVIGYEIYECPEHGEFRVPKTSWRAIAKTTPCPWATYDGWRNAIGERCYRASEWRRHEEA